MFYESAILKYIVNIWLLQVTMEKSTNNLVTENEDKQVFGKGNKVPQYLAAISGKN